MQSNTFETERLLLRPTTLADAALFLDLLNTPKWLAYIGDRNVYSLTAAQDYIKERIYPQFERLGFGNYTVIRKEDGVKIGCCGLYDREGLEGVDIGFAFLPAYEQKGYGIESASLMSKLAFDTFGQTKISAITSQKNKGSQRLLEKLGFQFLKLIQLPNDTEELMYYELNEISE